MIRPSGALLLALVLGGCGPSVAHVKMSAENDSGEDGTATLTQKGNDLEVVLNLAKGADTGSQPAHIHLGSCPGLGDIVKPLTAVKDGTSTTLLVDTKLEDFSGNKYVINIHNSQQNTTYVSCGVIP